MLASTRWSGRGALERFKERRFTDAGRGGVDNGEFMVGDGKERKLDGSNNAVIW